jgi:hypothetical protein
MLQVDWSIILFFNHAINVVEISMSAVVQQATMGSSKFKGCCMMHDAGARFCHCFGLNSDGIGGAKIVFQSLVGISVQELKIRILSE